MSSRSAGGRRRQMRVKDQADSSRNAATISQSPPLPSTSTSPDTIGVYIPPSPSMQFQPLTPPMKPFAPSPLIIANPDDRWHTQKLSHHEFRQPSAILVHSGAPYGVMRLHTPGSSPEFLSPLSTSSSFQSQSPTLSPSSLSPQMILPISAAGYPTPPSSSLLLEHHPQDAPSETSTFVYPTCRSTAHPSRSSPTSTTFPKLTIKTPKKKLNGQGDAESPVELHAAERTETSAGGRFRALLRRSKRTKKDKGPKTAPTPLTPEDGSSRRSTIIISHDTLPEHSFDDALLQRWLRKHDMTLHPYPSDAPYMRAYDSAFLQCDQQTTALLRRLNSRGSPSFHDYGKNPPNHVLDLGCGTGHWAVEAAMYWKSEGTRVTGFDLVDLTSDTWGRGTAVPNVRFVRGNFVKYRLPFPDKTFDLVRMANLTLAIPDAKWDWVLTEIRRVMTIGARLEVIDDQMIFPLTIPIPSHSLESPLSQEEDYDLDDLRLDSSDDDDRTSSSEPTISDDTDSIIVNTSNRSHGHESESTDYDSIIANPSIASKRSHPPIRRSRGQRPGRPLPAPPSTAWDAKASTAQGLETIFETMLNERYGIHPRPGEYLLDVLRRVFGSRHASLMRNFHVELAPTELHADSPVTAKAANFASFQIDKAPDYSSMLAAAEAATSSRSHSVRPPGPSPSNDPLEQCPGIVLWPATFIPVPQPELEWHALKHVRTLLGCKSALADYVEVFDRDGVRVVDEDFWDALHDYESFIRERFDGLPRAPDARFDPSRGHSRHDSVVSNDSASTYQESVFEYQDLLRQHFDVPQGTDEPEDDNADADSLRSTPAGVFYNYDGHRADSPTYNRHSTITTSPPYTPQELTHIRTLRVFEAIKLGDEVLR
ncbi:hypothetical protein HGRIS_013883 [Hohenbuehelia grisea]|uniref:Methyltransferase domain-containing protein n=1 Tax=Hohenbuehelia grisea TaxID=104357 RepID=A0ABR3IWY7_9AGAR